MIWSAGLPANRHNRMPGAHKKRKALRCPTCGHTVLQNDPEVPFCSDRCRIIDLGKWASGAYRISSPALDPELLEESGGEPPHRE